MGSRRKTVVAIEPLPARRVLSADALQPILPGDANWDLSVNSADYAIVAASLGRPSGTVVGGQSAGDFNFDAAVDIDDLGVIDMTAGVTPGVFDVVGPKGNVGGFATYSGKITLDTDGAVLENFVLTGGSAWIEVAANNVTIRNFIIHGGTSEAADIGSSANEWLNTTIQDGEIYGGSYTTAVKISHGVAERLHLHDLRADVFRVKSNALVRHNYAHDFGQSDSAHGDAVQMFPTDGGDIGIVGNYFDATGANAALFQVDNGWYVEANYFAGGNYTVQCEGAAHNAFVRNTWRQGSYQFGAIRVGSGEAGELTWEENVILAAGGVATLFQP
jgi:hypothetical protein